jgi:hypothetical protein
MTKCLNCKSCLKDVWIENNHYLFCSLCHKVYIVQQRNLIEVDDEIVIKRITKMYTGVAL